MQFGPIFLISVIRNNTPLIFSSWYGHLDVTRFLVESGGNLEAKDNGYYTPTTLFFKSPASLYFGPIFLISVVSGYTPLICSSLNGHLDVTRFLVESGGNLEAKDNGYYTPTTLFFKSPASLYFGPIFLISVVRNNTPLIWSSLNGHLDVTRFLVERKADVAAKDK